MGLPGDRIQIRDGKVILNGRSIDQPPFSNYYYYNREDWKYGREGLSIEVPEDGYFVLGDNSQKSSDSRNWGFVPEENVIGRAICIWWPPKRIKLVH